MATIEQVGRIHRIAINLRVHYIETRLLRKMQSRDGKETGGRYVIYLIYLCTAGLGNHIVPSSQPCPEGREGGERCFICRSPFTT